MLRHRRTQETTRPLQRPGNPRSIHLILTTLRRHRNIRPSPVEVTLPEDLIKHSFVRIGLWMFHFFLIIRVVEMICGNGCLTLQVYM